jgi:hypothetical protein
VQTQAWRSVLTALGLPPAPSAVLLSLHPRLAHASLRAARFAPPAIHRAAGPRLLEACQQVPEVSPGVRCPTGEARITRWGP